MAQDFSNLFPTNQQQQVELDNAAKRAAFDKQYDAALYAEFQHRVQKFNEFYGAFWMNATIRPKQAILARGVKARNDFVMAAKEAEYLNSIRPNSVNGSLPEGISVTFNDDGSLKEYIEA